MNNTKMLGICFFIMCACVMVSHSMGNLKGCSETGGAENRADIQDSSSRQPAPDFELKNLGPEETVALADLKGMPVFIDFWASWCPPCRAATPDVQKLHSFFGEKIKVIGINLDNSPQAALDYIRKSASGYMQLEGYGSDVASRYGVSGIPAFFILDASGNLVKKYVGYSSDYYDEWVSIIEGLLSE